MPVTTLSPAAQRLLALSRNACVWPSGEHPDISWCGEPAESGSYCEAHRELSLEADKPAARRLGLRPWPQQPGHQRESQDASP
jgi:hypothetical protein